MRSSQVAALLIVAVFSSCAIGGLHIDVEIPRLPVAEYHPPYVAVWIARDNHEVATNLAVWYAVSQRGNEGEKWLKDLRQWWRRSGRVLSMPIDGVSGATRRPGTHQLTFESSAASLAALAAGSYQLVVEAAREVGGRETLRIDFQWPPQATAQTLRATGQTELGEVTLKLFP